MIEIELGEEIQFDQQDALIQAANAVVNHEKLDKPIALTVALEGDDRLRQLNRDFLGVDSVTDVLAFPVDEFDPDSQLKYIGDVVISVPQAARQAQHAGHPLLSELQLLVVHGVLHLLGYDHTEDTEKQVMWRLQAEILDEIGSNIKRLPE